MKGLWEAAEVGRVLERQTPLKPLTLNLNCFNACDKPCIQDRNEQVTHCSHALKVLGQTAHFEVVLHLKTYNLELECYKPNKTPQRDAVIWTS